MSYVFWDPPMDCDDWDTEGHKLQLAGESRTKSSSVLPYTFPRIDFDDSFQGHLRFDSLGETEVFPDIQDQRDNQWLEDYTNGSTIIDFSSSATESHTITRPNDVWSEATSIESVEMLLKSVGEEQIVPKDTISEYSNELGSFTKKMEPVFEHNSLNGGCTRISHATIPQDDQHLNNFTGLEHHVNEKVFQAQEELVQKYESSRVTCHVLVEECKAPVQEGDLLLDTKCDDKSERGGECPVHEYVARDGDGLSHMVVPYDNISSSSISTGPSQSTDEPVIYGVEGIYDSTKVADDAMKKQLATEETFDAETHIMEQQKVEDAMHADEISHSLSLIAKSVRKPAVEVSINSNESSGILCTQEIKFQLLEVKDGDNDMPTDDSELHATKLDNIDAEHHSNAEPKTGSVVQLDHKLSSDNVDNVNEFSHKRGGQGDDVSRSFSQSSLNNGDSEHSIGKSNNANIVDACESLCFPVSHALVDLTRDTIEAGSVKDLHGASAVSVEEAELQPSYTCRNEDISVEAEREDTIRLCSDVIDVSSDTCVALSNNDRVGSSAMMKSNSHDDTVLNQPQPEFESKMEPEIKFIACNRNIEPVEEDNNEDTNGQSCRRESSRANENEEDGARMSINSSSSILNESKQVAAEVDSVCNAKFGMHYESTTSQFFDTDGKLTPFAEACNNASESESHKENLVEYSKAPEVHSVCDNSPLNKVNVMEGYLSAADLQKVPCDFPVNISLSTAIIPDEGKQEVVGVSELVEINLSTPDPKLKDKSGDANSFTSKVNSLPDVGREKSNNWTPFPIAELYKSAAVSEGATTPDVSKVQAGLPLEISGHNAGEDANGMPKTTSGRKRQVSGKGVAKENSAKGINATSTTPKKSPHKDDTILRVASSPGSSSLQGQPAGLQPCGLTEQKSKNISTTIDFPIYYLSDLNASALKSFASSLKASQQPFTDLQQVQLLAQIFVYGSIIQGEVPDETSMFSAFGSSDRERGVWEQIWKTAAGRSRSKQSHSSGESPINSHSTGAKVPDVAGKLVSPQSKVVSLPVSPAGRTATPTTVLNPMIPLSSPVWSSSTPYHDGSQSSNLQRRPFSDNQPVVYPLHPCQDRPVQTITGHMTWPFQAPFSPSPCISQSSGQNLNSHLSTEPITATPKLTPVKDFLLPVSSGLKITSTLFVPILSPSTVLVGNSQMNDQTKGNMSQELPSANPEPRRRKKAEASSDIPKSPLTETIVASSLPSSTVMVPVSSGLKITSTPFVPILIPSTVLAGSSQMNDQTKGNLLQEMPSTDPEPRRRKKAEVSNDIPKSPLTETIVASSSPSSTVMVPVAIPNSHVTASVADVLPACSVPQPQVDSTNARMTLACSDETSKNVADAKLKAEEASILATTAVSHCQDLWNQLADQKVEMNKKDEVKIAAALGAASAAASVAKAAAAAARVASIAALHAKLMADEALTLRKTGDGAQSGSLVSNVHNVTSLTRTRILTGGDVSNQSGSILAAAREAAKRRLETASAAAKRAENLDAIVKAAELAAEAVSQAGKIVAMGDPLPLKEIINAGPEGYWKLPQASSKLALESGSGINEQINVGCTDVATKEYGGPPGVKGSEILDQEKVVSGEFSNDSSARNECGISESVAVGEKEQVIGKSNEGSSNRGLLVLGTSSGPGSVDGEQEELGTVQENIIKEGTSVEVYKNGDGIKPAWFAAHVATLHDGKAFVQYSSLLSKEGSDYLKEWVPLEGEGDNAPKIRAVLPMTALHRQGTRKRRRSAMINCAWAVGDMVDVCIQDSWREGFVKNETPLTVHFPEGGETSAVNSQQLRPSRIWSNGNWVERSRSKGHDLINESDTPLEKRPRLRSPIRSAEEKSACLDEARNALGKHEKPKVLALSASNEVFNIGKSTEAETKPDTRRAMKTGLQKEGSKAVYGVSKPGKKRKYVEVTKNFPAEHTIPRGTASRGLKMKNQSEVDPKERQASKAPTGSRRSRSTSNKSVPLVVPHGSSSGADEADEGPISSLFANKLSAKAAVLSKRKAIASGEQLTQVDEEKVQNDETDNTPSGAGEPRRSNRRFRPTHKLLEGLQSSLILPKMSGVKIDSKSALAKGK